jgi:hypothetical protein
MHNSAVTAFSVSVLVLMAGLLSGCGGVQRDLTINTNPPGALVTLNDEEIGLSPVTVSFNWYGDYSVRITKPGFETLNTHRKLKEPWYDGFPFDFIASFCWPARTTDSYEWTFELEPYEAPAREDLLRDAEKFKAQAMLDFAKKPSGSSR